MSTPSTCPHVARAMAEWEKEALAKPYDTLEEMRAHFKGDVKTRSRLYLDEKNPLPGDSVAVAIEEPHEYLYKGHSRAGISVTGMLDPYFRGFDEDRIATRMLASAKHRHGVDNPKFESIYRYYGCTTVDAIKAKWTEARDLGTLLHDQLELWLNEYAASPELAAKFECDERVACDFAKIMRLMQDTAEWRWSEYEVFRTEPVVSDLDHLVAGRMDWLFRHKEDHTKFVVFDVKRSAKIETRAFRDQRAFGALSHLPDCKAEKYYLQQEAYRRLFEQSNPGCTVVSMHLLQVHPDLGDDAKVLDVPDRRKEIDAVFAGRLAQVKRLMQTPT